MNHVYKKKKELAEYFGLSYRTIADVTKEFIKQIESGRYHSYCVIEGKGYSLINIFAFTDYMKYRTLLSSTRTKNLVPPFDVASMTALYGCKLDDLLPNN